MQYYLERCFPTIEQIVDRVRQVLADQKKTYGGKKELKRIYIMTNGDTAWLDDLKGALMGIKKWDSVTNSRDLRLGWEAKPVAQAMDMLVGQRADVFIGNGVRHPFSATCPILLTNVGFQFSSLTSNIVMFRMLRELPPEDSRFW